MYAGTTSTDPFVHSLLTRSNSNLLLQVLGSGVKGLSLRITGLGFKLLSVGFSVKS